MNNTKAVKVIYSQKLAGYLMNNGFVMLYSAKNKYSDSNRNVFFFKESDELERYIGEYIKSK